MSVAVLRNDPNTEGGVLSVDKTDPTSGLGASLTITTDNIIHHDSSVSATLQALLASQSLWDTFTYSIRDRGSLLDTATVKRQVSGLDETPGERGTVLGRDGSGSTAWPQSLATGGSLKTTSNTAANDKAIGLGTLDESLGYLSWLYDFDLLGNGHQRAKKGDSLTLAVDAVFSNTILITR